jgi:hypothetical protein
MSQQTLHWDWRIVVCSRVVPWANPVVAGPKLTNARKTPASITNRPSKTRRLRNAEREVDFFFIVEAHCRLAAQVSRKRHLLWVALAPSRQSYFSPSKFLQPCQDDGLRLLFIPLAPFSRMMVFAHCTWHPVEQPGNEILRSERPASTNPFRADPISAFLTRESFQS